MGCINITLMKKNVFIAEKEVTAMAAFRHRPASIFTGEAAASVFSAEK